MKCPICDIELKTSDREGVEIDYCPQCRGVWLDRGELEKIIAPWSRRNLVDEANGTKIKRTRIGTGVAGRRDMAIATPGGTEGIVAKARTSMKAGEKKGFSVTYLTCLATDCPAARNRCVTASLARQSNNSGDVAPLFEPCLACSVH